MASVRRRDPKDPNSPWVCEYTDAAGKRRRYTPKTGLKKDADTFRRKVEGELERGEHVASSESATVAEAVASWLDGCERRMKIGDGITRASFVMYRTCAGRLSPSKISALKVRDLTLVAVQDFADQLAERLSPKTLAHTFEALKLVLDHAIGRGWLKRNLLRERARERRLRLPAVERRTSIPTKEQLATVLSKSRERLPNETAHAALVRSALVNLVLHCGLRPGEVAGLKWEHVDLVRAVIRVRHSFSRYDGLKGPKSRAGMREVALVDPARDALLALRGSRAEGRRSEEGFVFASRTGKAIRPLNLAANYWRPLADACGIKNRLYDLRHAAASLRIEHGLSPLHIKTFMGHAKIATTLDVYGHLFPQDEAARRAAFDIAASLSAVPRSDNAHTLDAT